MRDIVEQEYALQQFLAATLFWFAAVAMAVAAAAGYVAAVRVEQLHPASLQRDS